MIHYVDCPICSSTAIKKVFSCQDYTVSHHFFDVFECANCTLRFTQDIPDINEIGAFYASENYISHTDTEKGLVNKLYHFIRKHTLQQKKKLIQQQSKLKNGVLLDIGCGTGAFVETMQTSGWDCIGLEPDSKAREISISKNIACFEPSYLFSLPEKKFDVITLWHVLEHVHDLHQYIIQCKKILKDNGLLIIAVPNYTSSDANHYDEFWAAYDVPRHLYHFSPKAMNYLVEKHQFTVSTMKPMWFDSYYVSLLSESYQQEPLGLLKAFKNGTISNYHAFSNPEVSSSIIYLIRPTTA